VKRHQEALENSGHLDAMRADQARTWMWSEVQDSLIADLKDDPEVQEHIPALEAAASSGRIPAATAAERLLDIYRNAGKP
jgi:LAO/AO transport system kinase